MKIFPWSARTVDQITASLSALADELHDAAMRHANLAIEHDRIASTALEAKSAMQHEAARAYRIRDRVRELIS